MDIFDKGSSPFLGGTFIKCTCFCLFVQMLHNQITGPTLEQFSVFFYIDLMRSEVLFNILRFLH
jgi:hypothetical protein